MARFDPEDDRMRRQMIPLLLVAVLAVAGLAPPAVAQQPDSGLRLFAEAYRVVRDDALAQPTAETLLRGADAGMRTVLRDEGQPDTALGELQLTGDERWDLAQFLQRIQQVQSMVRSQPLAVVYAALAGMIASLRDPNSGFYPPDAFAEFIKRITTGDEFVGIGVVIENRDGRTVIIEVLDGSPASEAGVQSGDVILRVNGAPVAGLSLDQVSQMIRGDEGTAVRVDLQRQGQTDPVVITLTRRRIAQRVVTTRLLPSGVGYLRLTQFTTDSPDLVGAALQTLLAQGAKGIVLDMRGNPGGLLDASVKIASHFLESGVVVTVESARAPAVTFIVQPRTPKYTGPLVVLVDRGSASAAEVVAGALQDAGIKLVGTRTYGKATVQTVYSLPGGSGMRMTTAHYLTPAGRNIDGQGLMPDVEVATGGAPIGSAGDAPLNRAVAMLLQQAVMALPQVAVVGHGAR
jgi:carboxyl-terminal processing protease